MRCHRRWLIGLAVPLAGVAVVGRLAVPALVRWGVAGQQREATGRGAAIAEARPSERDRWASPGGVRVLRDRERPSADEGGSPGRRRLEAGRADLLTHARVETARLRLDDAPAPARDGAGRVELTLATQETPP